MTYSAKKWKNTHFQTSQVLEADQRQHWSISVYIMHALAAAAYAFSASILLAGNQPKAMVYRCLDNKSFW